MAVLWTPATVAGTCSKELADAVSKEEAGVRALSMVERGTEAPFSFKGVDDEDSKEGWFGSVSNPWAGIEEFTS